MIDPRYAAIAIIALSLAGVARADLLTLDFDTDAAGLTIVHGQVIGGVLANGPSSGAVDNLTVAKVESIPEPATLVLLGLGLALINPLRLRRRTHG